MRTALGSASSSRSRSPVPACRSGAVWRASGDGHGLVARASTTNGPAIFTLPLPFEHTGDSRYAATGAIPIASLPAADYVVRAMVGIRDPAMTRVIRTLRKTIR